MGSGEPIRARAAVTSSSQHKQQRKPRQEISACLKWLVFGLNSIVFVSCPPSSFPSTLSVTRLTKVVLYPHFRFSDDHFAYEILSFGRRPGGLRKKRSDWTKTIYRIAKGTSKLRRDLAQCTCLMSTRRTQKTICFVLTKPTCKLIEKCPFLS